MASTQMTRVDAFGILPSLLIVLMSILAILGSSPTRRPCSRATQHHHTGWPSGHPDHGPGSGDRPIRGLRCPAPSLSGA